MVGVFLFLVTVACVVLPLFSSDRYSALMGKVIVIYKTKLKAYEKLY